MKVKLLKGLFKGMEFEARILRKAMFEIAPSIQVLEGPLMGEIIPYEFCVKVEEKDCISKEKWHQITYKADSMIAEWIETPFTGSRIADRMKFSKRLTDFIKKELSKQT